MTSIFTLHTTCNSFEARATTFAIDMASSMSYAKGIRGRTLSAALVAGVTMTRPVGSVCTLLSRRCTAGVACATACAPRSASSDVLAVMPTNDEWVPVEDSS